jgi:hypothetical protein
MEIKTKSDIIKFIDQIKIGQSTRCMKDKKSFFIMRNKEDYWTVNFTFCNKPSTIMFLQEFLPFSID